MSQNARRTFVALVTLLTLSLPLAAAAQPILGEGGGAAPHFLTWLWSRVTAPLTILWERDTETGAGSTEGVPAPVPSPIPEPVPAPDGRSVIDPLG